MAKYRSSTLAKKRKRAFIVNSLWIITLLFSSVYLISEISKIDRLSIEKIEIIGNEVIKSQELRNFVSDKISDNYLGLFPKKNILIYPKYSIKKKILIEFPRIKDADLKLNLPNMLKVIISERKPYALYCQESEKCFFVDDKGYVFSLAPNFSQNVFFKYYTRLSKNPIKQRIFEKNMFDEIDSFIRFVSGLGLNPYKFSVTDQRDFEIYYGNGGRIIFGSSQDIKSVMDNLQAILNMEDFDVLSVDYIDLRFGNKVFYK